MTDDSRCCICRCKANSTTKRTWCKDSKSLNDDQITAIAKQLLHVVPYSSLVLHNEKYNELFDKGNNQGKLKALLHNKAITNLLGKMAPTKPEGVLIDQFTQPDTYYKYLTKQNRYSVKMFISRRKVKASI